MQADHQASGTAHTPGFDLARLIAPTPQEDFFRDHWEQRPLLVQRHDPGFYAGLLTLDDFDSLLDRSGPDHAGLRVVAGGRMDPVAPETTLADVYDSFRHGATLLARHVSSSWEPLGLLSRSLGRTIGAEVWANCYLTPGGRAQGFAPHCDNHDVLVAQIHGTKRWRLYGVRDELPLEGRMFKESRVGAARFEQEFTLEAGDLLYLPRGVIHAAVTEEEASLHCTIGIKPVLWSHVIEQALRGLFDQDVAFRRALPTGFADRPETAQEVTATLERLVATLAERLSPQEMAQRARSLVPTSQRGRLHGLAAPRQAPAPDA
jgi:ribosomal protein L16 Arg81 hydroxylase